MGKGRLATLPTGQDQVVLAGAVRAGMWMIDPETGEWALVKQFEKRRYLSEGAGKVSPVCLSLRRLGAREMDPETPVTVRVPDVG